jgi:predicted ribosome quality control (RQC) complex YloA/Tae2 family protein
MKEHTNNSITFKVGENSQDNWKIILAADRNSWWLHADGHPSAHIIIDTNELLEEDLAYAFSLCKTYTSKHKIVRYVATQVSNLKLGSKPGEVFFKKDANVIRGT